MRALASVVSSCMEAPGNEHAGIVLRIDASTAGYRQLVRSGAKLAERGRAVEKLEDLKLSWPKLIAWSEADLDVATTATPQVREFSRRGRQRNDVRDR